MDAVAHAERVHQGDISGVEFVDDVIRRIEKLNPVLDAVTHERFE